MNILFGITHTKIASYGGDMKRKKVINPSLKGTPFTRWESALKDEEPTRVIVHKD